MHVVLCQVKYVYIYRIFLFVCIYVLLLPKKNCKICKIVNLYSQKRCNLSYLILSYLIYDVNNKHRDFLNMVTSFGCLPYIIYILIDNIYSNNLEDKIISGNILIQFADHLAQFLSINRNIDRITPGDAYHRDFTNFNDLAFKDDISRLDWNLNNSYGINEKFNTFLSKMENCIDLHAPIKKLTRKQIRKTSKPWINLYIIKMISHRNKLFKRNKENPLNNKIKIT